MKLNRQDLKKNVKKGFSSIWQDYRQIEELLPAIASARFDGIEPTFINGAIPSPEYYREQAPELRARTQDLGLEIPSLRGGRAFWQTIPSPDATERAHALEHTEKAMECLALMGGQTLLVVPGQLRSDVSYEEHWKRVVDFAHSAGELALQYNLTIGLENVEARFPLSQRDWRDLLAEIDHPRVRMYLDIGNILMLGLGFPQDWINFLQPWIFQLHFKDATLGQNLRNLLAGEIDWKAVTAALRHSGYTGWICVEPEWYDHAPWRLPQRLYRDLEAILEL